MRSLLAIYAQLMRVFLCSSTASDSRIDDDRIEAAAAADLDHTADDAEKLCAANAVHLWLLLVRKHFVLARRGHSAANNNHPDLPLVTYVFACMRMLLSVRSRNLIVFHMQQQQPNESEAERVDLLRLIVFVSANTLFNIESALGDEDKSLATIRAFVADLATSVSLMRRSTSSSPCLASGGGDESMLVLGGGGADEEAKRRASVARLTAEMDERRGEKQQQSAGRKMKNGVMGRSVDGGGGAEALFSTFDVCSGLACVDSTGSLTLVALNLNLRLAHLVYVFDALLVQVSFEGGLDFY